MKVSQILVLLFLSVAILAHSQTEEKPYLFDVGFGTGMDYGGFGLKIPFVSFSPRVKIVAGAGYNIAGLGWSAGLLGKTSSEKKLGFYLEALYGVNSVILFRDNYNYSGQRVDDKMYVGPSFGAGLELRGSRLRNYLKLGILLPLRSSAFEEDRKNITLKSHGLSYSVLGITYW